MSNKNKESSKIIDWTKIKNKCMEKYAFLVDLLLIYDYNKDKNKENSKATDWNEIKNKNAKKYEDLPKTNLNFDDEAIRLLKKSKEMWLKQEMLLQPKSVRKNWKFKNLSEKLPIE